MLKRASLAKVEQPKEEECLAQADDKQEQIEAPEVYNLEVDVSLSGGYLLKRGGGVVKSWKRNWFVADGHNIIYCEDKDSKRLGVITLDACTVFAFSEEKLQFKLANKHRKRVYYLQAPSLTEFNMWVNHIKSILDPLRTALNSVKLACRVDFKTAKLVCNSKGSFYEFEVEVTAGDKKYIVGPQYSAFKVIHDKFVKRYEAITFPRFPSTALQASPEHLELRRKLLNNYFKFCFNHVDISKDPDLRACFDISDGNSKKNILTIEVVGARYLVSRTSPLTPPTCSCVVTLFDVYRAKISGSSTCLARSTSAPMWNHEINFAPGTDAEGLTFSVWNGDTSGELIGEVNILLRSIPQNTSVEHWFPLQSGSKVVGDLKLKITQNLNKRASIMPERMPSTQNLLLKEEQKKERERVQAEKEKLSKVGEIRLIYCYNPPKYQFEGSLMVKVVSIRDRSTGSVTIKLGNVVRESVVEPNCTSIYKGASFFTVRPHSEEEILSFDINVYNASFQRNSVGGESNLIGSCTLYLSDIELQVLHNKWVAICKPPEKSVPKNIGKKMAELGYSPNLPIILIPGLGSSALVVEEGYSEWKGERVWISFSKLLTNPDKSNKLSKSDERRKSKLPNDRFDTISVNDRASLAEIVNESETPEEREYTSSWHRHMQLHEDGCSDPPGIRVRPIKGKDGITCLTPGVLTGGVTWVMGPLIDELHDLGYTDDNLACMPYDWRLPPHYLEERDGFFTEMRATVEKMVKRCKSPVVLVAHSMGGKLMHYWLHMMKKTVGQEWIDEHIHTLMSISTPWLGSPKSLRAVLKGDTFGLNPFLDDDEAMPFIRSVGCTPILYPPFEMNPFYEDPNMALIFKKQSNSAYQPASAEEIFVDAGCSKQLEWRRKYYQSNEFFGGPEGQETFRTAPPVKRLFAMYGVDLPTEAGFFFKINKGKLQFGETPSFTLEGHKIVKGIIFETEVTKQKNIKHFTGIEGSRSGDGTVVYQSLNYCAHWRKQIPELRIEEIPKTDHRSILGHRVFFQRLIEYVAVLNSNDSEKQHGKLRTSQSH